MPKYQHFSHSEKADLLAPPPLPPQKTLLKHRLANVVRPCPITILAFRGGGVLGLGYAGALLAFEENHLLNGIKTVAGSSAGGLTAILVALGYTATEIKEIMFELELHKLVKNPDANLFQKFINYCFGNLDSGAILEKKIESYIFRKLGTDEVVRKLGLSCKEDVKKLTFAQLRALGKKELYLTGTNTNFNLKNGLPKGEVIFSHEHSPNMGVAKAGRITGGHPFLYFPVHYNGNWFIDGAVATPLPKDFFNQPRFVPEGYQLTETGKNPAALGLLIETEYNIKKLWNPQTPHAFIDWILHVIYEYIFRPLAFFGLYDRKQDNIKAENHTHIIPIYDLDIDSLNFEISADNKQALITSAQLETRRYLRQYKSFDVYLPNETKTGQAQYKYTSFKNFQEKYAKYNKKTIERIINYELTPAIKYYQSLKNTNTNTKAHMLPNVTTGLCVYKAEYKAAKKALKKF